jgi:polar amino acid transport system substrate-binding protein
MELASPPFEMLDEAGNPAGLSVDLAEAIAKSLGKELRVENIEFRGLIPALKTGKIDLIISSMTATEERAQSIDFTRPYLRTGLAMLVHAESTVRRVQELDHPDRKAAVIRGTTGHLYVQEHLKNAQALVLADQASCVLEVVQGKADAFFYDQISIYRQWMRHPRETRALLQPVTEEFWSVGVRKGNSELRDAIDQFLHDYQSDLGFERLGDKYLKEEKEAFAAQGVPFVF